MESTLQMLSFLSKEISHRLAYVHLKKIPAVTHGLEKPEEDSIKRTFEWPVNIWKMLIHIAHRGNANRNQNK